MTWRRGARNFDKSYWIDYQGMTSTQIKCICVPESCQCFSVHDVETAHRGWDARLCLHRIHAQCRYLVLFDQWTHFGSLLSAARARQLPRVIQYAGLLLAIWCRNTRADAAGSCLMACQCIVWLDLILKYSPTNATNWPKIERPYWMMLCSFGTRYMWPLCSPGNWVGVYSRECGACQRKFNQWTVLLIGFFHRALGIIWIPKTHTAPLPDVHLKGKCSGPSYPNIDRTCRRRRYSVRGTKTTSIKFKQSSFHCVDVMFFFESKLYLGVACLKSSRIGPCLSGPLEASKITPWNYIAVPSLWVM